MSTPVSHFGLGSIVSAVTPSKSNLKDWLALGGGSAAAVTLADLAQNKLLVSNGVPMIPISMAPFFSMAFGIVAGGIAKRQGYANIGNGMIAGGVGVGIAALVAKFTSPTTAASAAAAGAAEASGAPAQAVSGFGFGRTYARGLRGLSGLGALPGTRQPNPNMLFGVGTPDMRAARAFGNANVAIEQPGLAGASVAFQSPSQFAGALTG